MHRWYAPAPAQTTGKTARVMPGAQVTTCPNVTGISRYYAGVSTDRYPVRCGPQSEPYVTVVRREKVMVMRNGKPVTVEKRVIRRKPAPGTRRVVILQRSDRPQVAVTGKTRIVPRHVWEQQQAAKIEAPTPKGYRPAWTDDRLNEKRAHQTLDGYYASGLAWTNTVPRKLYVRSSGLVVTHKYPGLIYPYHTYEEMRAAGYNITDKGHGSRPAESPQGRAQEPRESDSKGQGARHQNRRTFRSGRHIRGGGQCP